jgi:hypothetical protein
VLRFALLVFGSPEAFAKRNSAETDPYLGAWRAYYKSLLEAGIYVCRRSTVYLCEQSAVHGSL